MFEMQDSTGTSRALRQLNCQLGSESIAFVDVSSAVEVPNTHVSTIEAREFFPFKDGLLVGSQSKVTDWLNARMIRQIDTLNEILNNNGPVKKTMSMGAAEAALPIIVNALDLEIRTSFIYEAETNVVLQPRLGPDEMLIAFANPSVNGATTFTCAICYGNATSVYGIIGHHHSAGNDRISILAADNTYAVEQPQGYDIFEIRTSADYSYATFFAGQLLSASTWRNNETSALSSLSTVITDSISGNLDRTFLTFAHSLLRQWLGLSTTTMDDQDDWKRIPQYVSDWARPNGLWESELMFVKPTEIVGSELNCTLLSLDVDVDYGNFRTWATRLGTAEQVVIDDWIAVNGITDIRVILAAAIQNDPHQSLVAWQNAVTWSNQANVPNPLLSQLIAGKTLVQRGAEYSQLMGFTGGALLTTGATFEDKRPPTTGGLYLAAFNSLGALVDLDDPTSDELLWMVSVLPPAFASITSMEASVDWSARGSSPYLALTDRINDISVYDVGAWSTSAVARDKVATEVFSGLSDFSEVESSAAATVAFDERETNFNPSSCLPDVLFVGEGGWGVLTDAQRRFLLMISTQNATLNNLMLRLLTIVQTPA